MTETAKNIKVCVFGSSSQKTAKRYVDEAYKLGQLLAERGHTCINGGGSAGVMGGVNRGCRSRKGEIIGVIHEKWCVDKDEDTQIEKMVICGGTDLDERKRLLMQNGECLIALPGGVGTFDELWDAVCCKSLNMKAMKGKPICLLNIDGYYDGFVQQINRAYADGLLYDTIDSYLFVAKDLKVALDWCEKQVTVIREEEAKKGSQKSDELSERIAGEEERLSARVAQATTATAAASAAASDNRAPGAASGKRSGKDVPFSGNNDALLSAVGGFFVGFLACGLIVRFSKKG